MHSSKDHFKFHIGQRNIKTAIAATICAVIYFFIKRNPTFACIGAVFGLGNDMENSFLNGGNRFFGTVIGGFLGMLLFRIYIIFYPNGGFHFLLLVMIFIGTVILILLSQMCHWPGSIQPGSVVLCIILFNTPVETYISYSLNRMLDTGIGVLVSLLINYLFPRERVTAWLKKLHHRKLKNP